MSDELERRIKEVVPVNPDEHDLLKVNEVLKGNTFGIIESEGTIEDKIGRLLALLPVAFQVVDEARATIARLREENDRLRSTQSANDTDSERDD